MPRACALLALSAALLYAQVAEPPKPGTITLTFVDSYTHIPITDVTASLRNLGGGRTPQTTPGNTGELEFTDLLPERYFIGAVEAPGYTFDITSQRDGFNLHPGEHLKVSFPLDPSCSITGTIVDTDGKPVAGATVQTLSSDLGVFAASMKTATTGSDGEYTIAGLKPGRYVARVAANTQLRIPNTYYPNGDDGTQAVRFDVAPGREGTRVDFRVRHVSIFHLRGTVEDAPANAKPVGYLRPCDFSNRREIILTLKQINVGADRSFDMEVVPGSYCIEFQTNDGKRATSFAQGSLRVTDRDLNNLRFDLQGPKELTGRVKLEEGAGLRMPPTINLASNGSVNSGGLAPAEVKSDGSFRIAGVLPIDYRLLINTGDGYIRSLKLGGLDMTDSDVNMITGAGPLEIQVALARGRANIKVKVGSAKPTQTLVVLWPVNSAGLKSDLLKIVPTDDQGDAALTGLAPGLYKAYAFADADQALLKSSEFLDLFPSIAVRVSDTEQPDINLRLIPRTEFDDAKGRL